MHEGPRAPPSFGARPPEVHAAYGWAFAKPVRKVFYNITITSNGQCYG
ncbi:hypothetical protein GCM10017581_068880 [Dactylosporangium matsuzakiense]|uniref:Uncharacterized protein n=1 Tax=Dactylosporangium matsuzakiense TaxID=53360 RepID=A0A9W6NQD3_9ACTN|nr:hypothetical protein GCM10017581_068880 [Dactylosporangium matsuzakiense]